MKIIKTFVFLIALFVTIPLISASAQVETQDIEATTEIAETISAEDKSTGRTERLESYKAKVATKLADAQAKRIVARCKTAQVKISAYRKTATTLVENRTNAYIRIGEKLDALLVKMQMAELNTVTLETAREDMRADLVTLNTSFENYDTALADLEAMDCASDPDSFNAALVEARNLQASLKTQAQEFRQFASEQIKLILQDIRQQIVNKTEQTQTNDSTGE